MATYGLKPFESQSPCSPDKTHAVGEIDAKCFCIFGMVQHIFTRIDLYPQDAASTLFNEML
ncbi:hypothetical protein C9383_15500 [Pseudomonas palleroniana]|uniref:Uncharacterized protein n=1 Tax=Pseudomonas palleroniana TaxID=191390 RepID=A0A2T4FQR8_9PSED|nr:hypothetical protein C9383_15500 [Pseudomonas palleroniana]